MTTSQAPSNRRRGGYPAPWPGVAGARVRRFRPSTGERIVLYETVPIADAQTKTARDRAEREAHKEAEKILTRLQGAILETCG